MWVSKGVAPLQVNTAGAALFNTTDSGERSAHSTNIYEPPSDDWCVAQRVNTATLKQFRAAQCRLQRFKPLRPWSELL